jgi:uncharacterized protein
MNLQPQAAELPHATPGDVTAPFWDACRRSELLYQRCTRCGAVGFPPAQHCRGCLARELHWEQSAGRGRLDSWTVVHRAVTSAFATPYAPAIVTLDEGYQMVTNVINAEPGNLCRGLPLRVTFVKVSRGTDVSGSLVLPYFEPDR